MYTFPILWNTASTMKAVNAAAALIYISRHSSCMTGLTALTLSSLNFIYINIQFEILPSKRAYLEKLPVISDQNPVTDVLPKFNV